MFRSSKTGIAGLNPSAQKALNLDGEDLIYTIHTDIKTIESDWQKAALPEHFASVPYLKTLEHDSPDNLTNIYILIKKKNGGVVAAVLAQLLILSLGESFRYENYSKDRGSLSNLWQRFRQFVVNRFRFRMLTIGNLYLTGPYGYHFVGGSYKAHEQIRIIGKLVYQLRKDLKCTDYRFRGVLLKDYFEDERIPADLQAGLVPFTIDPNMILTLNPEWQSFEDYLSDMRSKYRIRLKNAIRKFAPLQKRPLGLEDIATLKGDMYALYHKILDGSGFVLAKGEKDYFYTLKKELGSHLKVTGYFKDEVLVGFYTWVIDGKKLDSHFIGVEPSLNLRHQIYLNILLDLVRDAISQKALKVYYYRTALEIKSSIGAEPYDMWCYFKHNNWVINKFFIPTAFKYFVPKPQWVQRHPFKSQAKRL